MLAIDILVKEHDSILKVIEITQTILNTTDKSTVKLDHVEQIIDFIKNFADKYHHLKEEDVLFMEMERHGMPRDGGPIGVMLYEHDEGRKYIKQAVEAIGQLKLGNDEAFEQIKENLLNYCTLLTNHIAKENNILYPMAERLLPADVKSAMTENFEETNLTTVDNEYFDKYMKLVDELSAVYLK
ncbi:MAG: hemerythrin domain-containing protein [Paludibacter sp.]|nr:hemerythrin domain-containing protein [Paludibacter sp.]